jgi:hypothetical protein
MAVKQVQISIDRELLARIDHDLLVAAEAWLQEQAWPQK